jgi:FAM192A/Fyv6, N-terminal domain
MSLSFVTKAIQTTAADGTFEEKAVDNDDDKKQGTTRGGNTIGLFDQLRQNRDEEEMARLEFQRSIMRGTLALDEDDAAHLQELQKQKEAEHDAQLRYTEMQLASFRASQAERYERSTTLDEHQQLSTLDTSIITSNSIVTAKLPNVPIINIKKRRRQEHQNESATVAEISELERTDAEERVTHDGKNSIHTSTIVDNNNNRDGTISSLLVGYSSDEDDL